MQLTDLMQKERNNLSSCYQRDTAGLGADIFESYCGSMIAAIAIGASMSAVKFEYIALPPIVAMVGLIASIIGIRAMDVLKGQDPSAALRNCTFVSAGSMLFVSFFVIKVMGLSSGVFIAYTGSSIDGTSLTPSIEGIGPPVRDGGTAGKLAAR